MSTLSSPKKSLIYVSKKYIVTVEAVLNYSKYEFFHEREEHGLKKSPDVLISTSFVGTEVSELFDIFILNKVNKIVHIDSHGIYRNDGLLVVLDNKRTNDSIRKKAVQTV